MGILKSKTNKKFSYTPRYYDDKGKGNPYKIEHKFDEFRSTVGANKGLKSKFLAAIEELKDSSGKQANRRILWITAILILLFLFIIDFDLTIFF